MIEIINKLIVGIHNHVTYPYRLIHRCLNAIKMNKNYIFAATGLFTYYTRMFDKNIFVCCSPINYSTYLVSLS